MFVFWRILFYGILQLIIINKYYSINILKQIMSQLLKIHKKYPLMLPQCNFTVWNGVLNIKEEPVALTISVPNYPLLDEISVKCNKIHEKMLSRKFHNLSKELEEFTLLEFFDYIHNGNNVPTDDDIHCGLPLGSTSKKKSSKTNYCQRFKHIISEIKEIGVENIHECNGDLTSIKLLVIDEREEEHHLTLHLPDEYPFSPATVVQIDLPDVVTSQITQATTIKDMFLNFQSVINLLQNFWNSYEMLQQKTWIIDPEHPRKKDTYCRIVINDNVSVLLTLNPVDVTMCPDIKFLGSDNAVLPLRTTVEENLKEFGWDEDLSIYSNLLVILGLNTFPQRTEEEYSNNALFQSGECCICFTLRLEDDLLPTKICNNPKCSSFYHVTCLSQWFQAIPTNEPSFNLIPGECPCCGERILCPIRLL